MAARKRPVITILDARPMADVSFNYNDCNRDIGNGDVLPQKSLISGMPLMPPLKPTKPPKLCLTTHAASEQTHLNQMINTSPEKNLLIKTDNVRKAPVPVSRKIVPSITSEVKSKPDESRSTNKTTLFGNLSASQECLNFENQNIHSSRDESKTPGIDKDSISFSKARSRFGGDWLVDKEAPKMNGVQSSIYKNKATIIRPKSTFIAKSSTDIDQIGVISQAPMSLNPGSMQNSFNCNLAFFENSQQNSQSIKNIVQLNKPCVPRKPTIIRPKPMSRSVILTEKQSLVDFDRNEIKTDGISGPNTAKYPEYIRSSNLHGGQMLEKTSAELPSPDNEVGHDVESEGPVASTEICFKNTGDDEFMVELASKLSRSDSIHQNITMPNNAVSIHEDITSKQANRPPRPTAGPRGHSSEVGSHVQGPRAIALFDYNSDHPDDLSFKVDEVILLDRWVDETWLKGWKWPDERKGMFPSNFVRIVEPLPDTASGNFEDNHLQSSKEKPKCLARYDFEGVKENGELRFKKGDVIHLIEEVNSEWYEGDCNVGGHMERGIFPVSFVENVQDLEGEISACEPLQEKNEESASKKVLALHDFDGGQDGDLTFKAGDIIEVFSEINEEWMEGRIGDQTGIFPSSFIFQ